MFAYQRSASHGTAIERILYGSFTGPSKSDVVLVKGSSLELLQLKSNPGEDGQVLTSCFEQPAFGTITDARTLTCNFGAQDLDGDSNSADMEYDDDEEESDDCLEFPYAFKVREDHSRIQGEDVIVAVSEYGKLVFWTLSTPNDNLEETGRFEPLTEVFMDEPGLEYNKVCKRLAVDPHSRAIAVASFEDRFDIMILRESMSRSSFNPIIGMGSVAEEGIIWHMEFLHTETASRDRILLALVVYSDVDHQCRTIVYAVDASNPDDVLIERIGRLPLDTSTPVPILLIPLRHYPEALVLLTEYEAGIVTTDDIACGNMLYPTCPIERPFGEVKCPLFTAFASSLDDGSNPYIYLGADDGSLYKMQFPSIREIRWKILDPINPVAPAMCILGSMMVEDGLDDSRPYLADVLLYSGEGADSQIITIDRSEYTMNMNFALQTLVNRAPIIDSRVASAIMNEQSAVICCSGQANQGTLSLISRGVQSLLYHKSVPSWQGFTRLWNAQMSISDISVAPLLVASSALETRLMLAQDGELSDITNLAKIEAHQRTIVAGYVATSTQAKDNSTANNVLFAQVYQQGVVLIENVLQGHIIDRWSPKAFNAEKNFVITLATIVQVENRPSKIVLCLSDGSEHVLLALSIAYEDGSVALCLVPDIILAISEPSYIQHFNLTSAKSTISILVVGTYDPSLLIYKVEATTVKLLCEKNLEQIMEPELCSAPHSAAILFGNEGSGDKYEMQRFLLLGLRQGTILSFRMEDVQTLLSDTPPAVLRLGTCAVLFDTGNIASESILALSDRLWRVRYNTICPQLLEVEPVLLPNFSSSVESMVSLSLDKDKKIEGVGVVADGHFNILRLSSKCTVGTRKISIGETPNKLLYDKASNCAFVVTTTLKDSAVKSTLRLVDLSSNSSKTRDKVMLSHKDFGYTDEILCMTEWTVRHRERDYRYLCLGIGQTNMSTRSRIRKIGTERGVLILYRLKSTDRSASTDSPSPTITTSTESLNCYTLRPVWNQEHFPGGIFAICPHPAGLLFSAGSVVHLYQLDPGQGKLVEITRKALRFLITSIDVDGDKICITCQNDSITFYTYNEDEQKLDFYKSDTTARTVHHSTFLDNQIAVGSCQSGGLIALRDDPDDRSFEQRLLSLFSFHYPDIVIRPTLGSLLPHNLLDRSSHAKSIASHVLPWVEHPSGHVIPILGSTVSGGLVTVHHISPALFELFDTLQERLVHYRSAGLIILGSAKNFQWFRNLDQREHNVVHGDLLMLYLRLTREQQQEVIQLEIDHKQPSFLEATREFLGACRFLDNHGDRLHRSLTEEGNDDVDDEELLCKYSSEIALMMDRLLRAMERYC